MIARRTAVQFARFSGVGVMGAVAHYSVLIGAVEVAGLSPVAGAMMGAVAGATVIYVLTRLYVFRTRRSHLSAIARFLATAAGSAALNGGLMALLVTVLALPYLPAQLAVTALLSIGNFLASRHWTFRDPAAGH